MKERMRLNLVNYFDTLFSEAKKATNIDISKDEFARLYQEYRGHPCLAIIRRSGHGDWCFGFDENDNYNLKLGSVYWAYHEGSFKEEEDIPLTLLEQQDLFMSRMTGSVESMFSTIKNIKISVDEFKVPKIKVTITKNQE